MRAKSEREEGRELARRPFGELELLSEWPFPSRLSRLLEEMQGNWPGLWPGLSERGFLPAMDMSDDAERYTITVEIPGARREDVHVEVQEGMLTIRGEKKEERKEKKEQRRYVERRYGSFSRSFRLPPDADADRLEASFKDGVLTLAIPKTEEAKPRTIVIR